MTGFDPRSVANTVLSVADDYQLPVTHLGLQKILYFLHGQFLTRYGDPLVTGYFEAWQYGPVHPVIYASFKDHGAKQIDRRATRRDLMTGEIQPVAEVADSEVRLFIIKTSLQYLAMNPGRLVDLSHAKGSPWDYLTQTDDGKRKFGVRITNDHINKSFKYHKMSVNAHTNVGEPDDESPPS